MEEAIRLLGLGGIGGGRSTGTGELNASVFSDNHPFNKLPKAKQFCCVSYAIPASEEEFGKFDLYNTKIRGGRKMDNGKQKFVRMIEEGAVLSGYAKGKLVEIGTDEQENRVLRNGTCFFFQ